MEDSEQVFIFILLLLFLIWFAIYYNKEIWVYLNRFGLFIEEHFAQEHFPGREIPIWSRIINNGSPCNPPPNSGGNVINITCGGSCDNNGGSPCNPGVPCGSESPSTPVTCPKPQISKKYLCPTICGTQSEVTLGCYHYIIEQLPGFIYKYQLDTCGNVLQDTRVIITHNFGILKRISVNLGKIVVEDSYSVEHIAIVDTATGNLTF
jgi:hypothetical protein